MAVYDPRGGGNVHIDQVLTNISVAWPNAAGVGENLAPSVRVRKQSDKYYVFGREGWVLEPGSDVRAPGGEANEIPGLTVATTPYFALEHALQIAVTDEERENADSPLSPDRDGTELVTAKVLLQRELILKSLVTTAANYATGHSVDLGATFQWDTYATSNPIADVKLARTTIHSKIFLEPNYAVIPWAVMTALEDHPDFIERIKYSQTGVVSQDLISSLFNIQSITVPGMGYNTAPMGTTESLAYLWGDNVIVAYVPQRAGLRVPAFMYEFTWVYPGGQTQVVERWREQRRRSDVIRVSRRYEYRLIALDGTSKSIAGYLIADTLTPNV
jgi:hypothetical protein